MLIKENKILRKHHNVPSVIMEPHLNSVEAISNERKFYGRSVMAALNHLGVESTSDDVVRNVAYQTGQPIETVRAGVERSLIVGARIGFFVRKGNKFSMPRLIM